MAWASMTLKREDLYDLVWQTPMSRLAERFSLSGNGLAKICRRLEVPCPPPEATGRSWPPARRLW